MKIVLVVKAEEILYYSGLMELLYKITLSLKKTFNVKIEFYEDNIEYNGCIITAGSVNLANQSAHFEFDRDYGNIAYSYFEAVKSLFCSDSAQYTVKIFGDIINIEKKLREIEKNRNGSLIFFYREDLITTVKIFCSQNDKEIIFDIYSAFRKNIYADEDISLSKMLLELLRVRNKTLSVAESLTGGMICSFLVDNSGASLNFNEGMVTYSNASKIKRLKIDEEIIRKYGAVSSETAYEMAAGLIGTGTDISLATTGLADGGTLSKPAGLTYIAVGTKEKVHIFRHIFVGSRNEVRKAASYAAMFYAIKILKDNSIEYEEIVIN